MKVTEFIEKFKSKGIKNTMATPTAVSDYVRKNVEIKPYLSITEKREMCAKVLDNSCIMVGNIMEVDSVRRYLFFTISIISKYTNLEFENTDDVDAIDQYDLLCQNGLLNEILSAIGGEYETCNNILNMMMSDIDANNNNIAVVVDRAFQKVLDYIGDFSDTLSEKVKAMQLGLNQIDIDKIMGVIDKLPKK